MSSIPRFLNVDVEVGCDDPEFVHHLQTTAIVLHEANGWVGFEALQQHQSPADCIAALRTLVNTMPPRVRALWNGASFRRFDIGYEVAALRPPGHLELPVAMLRDILDLGGELHLTFYEATPIG